MAKNSQPVSHQGNCNKHLPLTHRQLGLHSHLAALAWITTDFYHALRYGGRLRPMAIHSTLAMIYSPVATTVVLPHHMHSIPVGSNGGRTRFHPAEAQLQVVAPLATDSIAQFVVDLTISTSIIDPDDVQSNRIDYNIWLLNYSS
jgi:hypothetical protein